MAKAKLITKAEMDKAIQEALDGMSYSKSYEKIFTESDWTEADGQYTITLSSSEHALVSINVINLFKLTDNVYVMSHGIFDNLDYQITLDSNNGITITTTNAFSGKIVLVCNKYNGGSASDALTPTNYNFVDNFNLI